MKLFFSQLDLAHKLRSLLLELNILRRLWDRCVEPAVIFTFTPGETTGVNVLNGGKRGPMTFSAVLTYRWRLLQQENVLLETYHTVMQLLRTYSIIPL